jgi:hypothetical protein
MEHWRLHNRCCRAPFKPSDAVTGEQAAGQLHEEAYDYVVGLAPFGTTLRLPMNTLGYEPERRS